MKKQDEKDLSPSVGSTLNPLPRQRAKNLPTPPCNPLSPYDKILAMEELSPIRTIKANFGQPIRLTCPRAEDFIMRMTDEVSEIEEDPYAAYMVEAEFWENSITEEQYNTFKALSAKMKAAEKAYDPKKHNDNSPEAQAFFKADDEPERFMESTGKHLCFRCSHYEIKEIANGRLAAKCTRKNCGLGVRPFSIACGHYTTGVTPQVIQAEKDYAAICRQNPGFADYMRKRQREDAAKRFAREIKNFPSTAFYLYQGAPDYHEKFYKDFPLIMAETQYPSLPLFLEAYKRWEKDAIIKRERADDGTTNLTISVSDREFCPSDTPPPPTSAETSNN